VSKLTIYHNPRCSKSRQTLGLIEAAGIAPEVVLYLDTPPSVAELDRLVRALGVAPQDIVRQGEDLYKELGLAKKALSRQEWLQTLHDHPQLIERPIVIAGDKAVLGRPPENVQALLP
jgi:arsenate reductase